MKLSKPLKLQLTENLEWTWNSTHQDAFDENKEELTNTPVLTYSRTSPLFYFPKFFLRM